MQHLRPGFQAEILGEQQVLVPQIGELRPDLVARRVERERALERALGLIVARVDRGQQRARLLPRRLALVAIQGIERRERSLCAAPPPSRRRRAPWPPSRVAPCEVIARSRVRPRRGDATPSATRPASCGDRARSSLRDQPPPELDVGVVAQRADQRRPSIPSAPPDRACRPRRITRRIQAGTPRSLGSGRSCSVVTLTEMLSMSSPANGRSPYSASYSATQKLN